MKLGIDFKGLHFALNGFRKFHEETKESTLEQIKKTKSLEEVKEHLSYLAGMYHDSMAVTLSMLSKSFEMIDQITTTVHEVPQSKELADMMDNKVKEVVDGIVDEVQKFREEKTEEGKKRGIMYG
jgi:hypothetical protein